MFNIEPYEFAPEYVKAIYADMFGGKFDTVVWVRMYDSDSKKFPVLRDRTEEARKVLEGFGNKDQVVREVVMSGSELYHYDAPIAGGQFVYKYKFFFKADP